MKNGTYRYWMWMGMGIVSLALPLTAGAQVDHTNFITEYEGAVTCEQCHPGSIEQVQQTVHYRFESPVPENYLYDEDGNLRDIEVSGKWWKLCGFPTTVPQFNWLGNLADDPTTPHIDNPGGCGKCHVGVGYKPYTGVGQTEPQPNEAANVDCLVCHADNYQRKFYVGEMNGASVIMAAPIVNGELDFSGMTAAAQTVGLPKADHCNRCHAAAGGGRVRLDTQEYSFKRGSIYSPESDVHSAAGMSCTACHSQGDESNPHLTRRPLNNDLFAVDNVVREQTCLDCHGAEPHESGAYNSHAEFISCTGCHATSVGGAIKKDFAEIVPPDPNDPLGLHGARVDFAGDDFMLEFRWFNGKVHGEIEPMGSRGDGKIYPYKRVSFNQPVDANGHPIPVKWGPIFKTGSLQAGVDQGLAAYAAMWTPELGARTGLPETPGEFVGFNETSCVFSISHGITKEEALNCACCHSDNGVLDFEELGYSADEAANLTNLGFGDDCARTVPSSKIDIWDLLR